MNKNEFISRLDSYLKGMAYEDKKDILYDYEEHFTVGIDQGKTEEEISEALGDPKLIARQFRINYYIEKAESDTSTGNIVSAIITYFSVGFINLLLIPFIIAAACIVFSLLLAGGCVILSLIAALGSVIVSFYAAALGMTLGGIGTIIAYFIQPYFSNLIFIDINTGSAIFLSIAVICLGLLSFIGSTKFARLSYRWSKVWTTASYRGAQKCVKGFDLWILKYLKMNVDILKRKKENENA